MPVTNRDRRLSPTYKEVESYKFQTVHSVSCLGSGIKLQNDMKVEIKKKMVSASKCSHGLQKLLKSHLTLRRTKPVLYNVLTRGPVTYGARGGAVD